jgi:hypothetical protein
VSISHLRLRIEGTSSVGFVRVKKLNNTKFYIVYLDTKTGEFYTRRNFTSFPLYVGISACTDAAMYHRDKVQVAVDKQTACDTKELWTGLNSLGVRSSTNYDVFHIISFLI